MNPYRVVTEQELIDRLIALDFETTNEATATGKMWKCKSTGKYILVPLPYEEMYPDFILNDLVKIIGKIRPIMH